MYSTDIYNTGTVSATDEERLPPGGFSLRQGFPHWFGRASRRTAEKSRQGDDHLQTPVKAENNSSLLTTPETVTTGSLSSSHDKAKKKDQKLKIGVYEILRYIRSTFDTEEVLNDVPLEAAGNPGAWHAWRTHQIKLGKIILKSEDETQENVTLGGTSSPPTGFASTSGSGPFPAKRPGEWNWDGVWEVRVKKAVEGSISEAVLYGGQFSDDLIRFLHMQEDEVDTTKENIRRIVEAEALGRENSRMSLS